MNQHMLELLFLFILLNYKIYTDKCHIEIVLILFRVLP